MHFSASCQTKRPSCHTLLAWMNPSASPNPDNTVKKVMSTTELKALARFCEIDVARAQPQESPREIAAHSSTESGPRSGHAHPMSGFSLEIGGVASRRCAVTNGSGVIANANV